MEFNIHQFKVPSTKIFYILYEDFYVFNKGSVFSINYPHGRSGGGFTMCVHKKYNKDTPAKYFGCCNYSMIKLNTLKAIEVKSVYNNLTDEQLHL